jgi:5-methylcytosine-specific restriction endonuclease McrA
MHPSARDLTGLVVGRLRVVSVEGRTSDNHLAWLCECSCGKTKVVSSNSLTRVKPVQSCGCMNSTRAQDRRKDGGGWNEGKSYVIKDGEHCYKTRHGWAAAARLKLGPKCQECGWDKAHCDVHHIKPKSAGGLHTIANARVLCPNCHRLAHKDQNAP